MSIFEEIDPILDEAAKRVNGQIERDRPGYPEALRTFEERRITWRQNDYHL